MRKVGPSVKSNETVVMASATPAAPHIRPDSSQVTSMIRSVRMPQPRARLRLVDGGRMARPSPQAARAGARGVRRNGAGIAWPAVRLSRQPLVFPLRAPTAQSDNTQPKSVSRAPDDVVAQQMIACRQRNAPQTTHQQRWLRGARAGGHIEARLLAGIQLDHRHAGVRVDSLAVLPARAAQPFRAAQRSEEHTSELQS